MSQINPGLLYYRYYFDPQFDEAIGKGKPQTNFSLLAEISRNKKESRKEDKNGTSKAAQHFKKRHEILHGYRLPKLRVFDEWKSGGTSLCHCEPFGLRTTYPGLLIGRGYNHQVRADEAHIGGFYFDYTTGMPIIPGSTVKGMLRSVFPGRDRESNTNGGSEAGEEANTTTITKARTPQSIREAKTAYLLDLCDVIGIKLRREDLPVLEDLVFESRLALGSGENSFHAYVPGGERVIFHDAVVTGASGVLFGPDFITPHINRSIKQNKVPHEYVNPTPISFLKVMPEVTFEFRFSIREVFHLTDDRYQEIEAKLPILPKELCKLFRAILLDRGIGSKTRTGYGHLEPANGRWPWPREESYPENSTAQGISSTEEHARLLEQWAKSEIPTSAKAISKPRRPPEVGQSVDSSEYWAVVHARTKSKPGKRLVFETTGGGDTRPYDNYREKGDELSDAPLGSRVLVQVTPRINHLRQVASIVIRKIEVI